MEDTRDCLSRLSYLQEILENVILASFDVVGLYLNIPNDEGLCRLATIILKENYFKLGDEIFHQLLGTAIGTKFAPNYAKKFMAGL